MVEAGMHLEFREARWQDIVGNSDDDKPMHPYIASGRIRSWECAHDGKAVGHCAADSATGEIVGISVLPSYRRRGIGTKLLSIVVQWLQSVGIKRVWLSAPSDPALPAYSFYRALGWKATGELADGRSEILELYHGG